MVSGLEAFVMAKASKYGLMEPAMKASGRTTELMDKENSYTSTATSTKATG